jgi:hypothetical protein
MKKLFLLLFVTITVQLHAQDLSYYLPKNVTYNPAIPTQQVL